MNRYLNAGTVGVAQLLASMTPGQVSLYWIEPLGPGLGTNATAVSADGTVVVGRAGMSAGSDAAVQAFRWTLSGGTQGLGVTNGGSYAVGVSADGSSILGQTDLIGPGRPALWRPASGWVPLSGFTEVAAFAEALSSDGQVAVGSWSGNGAYRWNASSGPIVIGPTGATGVSGDGSVVSGVTATGSSYRWAVATGPVTLPPMPGQVVTRASAVSADGTTIVGWLDVAGASGIVRHAGRWIGTALPQDLGDLAGGGDESSALGVSADGSVIVGLAHTSLGAEAFLWTQQTGMLNLRSHLQSLGVPGLENFRLIQANAVSSDGRVIVGYGSRGTPGVVDGFVAVIPAPWSAVLFVGGLAASARRRRASGS